ncbi:MAG: Ni/Fe hydrogenase subunit alpha [Desulfurococcaceae archaeon]|nr:Ni/Fe hydrogenase subunit alpha [Desulfurococcaceae archaeon]
MGEYRLLSALDPITLVEGVARVVIVTSSDGGDVRALYQIMEFRGFEKLAQGRHVEDMPRIVSTICGFCSWSHHLASGKAVDAVFGRKPPARAELTRVLVNYVQILDSHLLHFAFIGLPDLALWGEKQRDITKLLAKSPEVASAALKTRTALKRLEKRLVGKIQHGPVVVPGGVARGLTREDLGELEKALRDVSGAFNTLYKFFEERVVKSELFKRLLESEEFTVRCYSMGLVRGGALEHYDGALRVVDSKGRVVHELASPAEYTSVIGEALVEWNHATLPYYKPAGFKFPDEESTIMVGPLARLNVAEKVPGEKASWEYKRLLEAAGGKPVSNVALYHWARLVEIIYSLEALDEMTRDSRLLEGEVVSFTGTPSSRGVGIVEAPRGVLIHDYSVAEDFTVTRARIITPTTINNTAINTNLSRVSARLVREVRSSGRPSPETVSLLESIVRSYDPCNSCATHCVRIGGEVLTTSFTIVVLNERGEVLWRG